MTSADSTPGGGWVPVPDPTVLTTAQLLREMATQREFLELQIAALKELTLARFEAAGEAVTKAEVASEKRLDSVNEFRAQLSDQAATFLTRREYEGAHKAALDSVAELRRQITEMSATVVPRLETDAWRQAMTEKFEVSAARNTDAIAALSSRMDVGSGTQSGEVRQALVQREMTNQRILYMGVGLSIVVIVVNVIIALISHSGKL